MDFEKQGSEVAVFAADAGDELQMLALIENVRQRFGAIHGVIHLAGKAGEGAIELIPQITSQDSDSHFRAKMIGTRVLERVIRGEDLDFVLLFSSNATVLGGVGLANYTAANLALDTFAQNARCRPTRTTRWISVNWDGWLSSKEKLSGPFQTSLDSFGMTTAEGVEALQRILASQLDGQIVVSTASLEPRLRLLTRDSAMDDQSDSWTAESHERPELETAYLAPRNELEQTIARIWQELLRVEKVGMGDNFFDLGGSSLIALKVIARLRKEVKARLPLVSIFEGPTVAALAQLISKPATEIDVFEESRDRGASRREQVQIATGGNSVSEILA
jgi:acyl carrier protein